MSEQDGLFLRMKFLFILLLSIFIIACNEQTPQQSSAEPVKETATVTLNAEGEHLFKVKCIQCHLPDRDFAAPALAGVEKRWADKKLLYAFVKNSQEVIQKDKYAADLFEKWKQAPMLPFPQLTNAEIDAIFEYCNQVAASR